MLEVLYVHELNLIKFDSPLFVFRGRCIVIYSYNKSQPDAQFLKYI